jgi:transcriptional regulator with XRE-family HTH domain
MERKNKGDVLTLDDVHPEIRFGIIAHRRRRRAELLVELARIMGIGNGEISRIETGERKPTRLHAAFIRYIRDNLNGRGWCV